jgi:hypothetical protein
MGPKRLLLVTPRSSRPSGCTTLGGIQLSFNCSWLGAYDIRVYASVMGDTELYANNVIRVDMAQLW